MPLGSLLRLARLGHALVDLVPGTALEVRRRGGPFVVVGPSGYPPAEVRLGQHRSLLADALADGDVDRYAARLGLAGGPADGALRWRLLALPGMDLGSGVLAVDGESDRRLYAATTLCAHHAARAARASQTLPAVVRGHGTGDPLEAALADLRVAAHHDPELGTTVLAWTHRPHPAAVGPVEDAVRAAAAACMVEELLLDAAAST